MSVHELSKEDIVKTFNQLLIKYEKALTENAEFEYLKKMYVELRELRWKILEFGYSSKYN